MTTELLIVARDVVKVGRLESPRAVKRAVEDVSSVVDTLENETASNSLLGRRR